MSHQPDTDQTGPGQVSSILPQRPRYPVYVLMVVMLSAALWISLKLVSVNGGAPVLMIFLIPIILCAYAGGSWPGLTATALAAALTNFFVLVPQHSFQIAKATDLVRWSLLCVIGILFSLISEALRRSRHRAEASERLQAVTLASIGDGVITTDPTGKITFLNREAERLTGWTNQEAVGAPLADVFKIVGEDARQAVQDPVEKVLRSGTVVGLANHTIVIARNGTETPIDDCGAPIKHADGTICGAVLVFRDCSANKRAEAGLRERLALQEQLAKIAATAPGVLCAYQLRPDGSTCIPYASPGFVELYGIHPEEVVNDASALSRLHHPDDDFLVKSATAESARTMTPWHVEFRVRHPQKGEVWIEGHSIPERGDDGSVFWHGFLQDVTQRKRAEASLHELQTLYHSLVEQMPVGIFHKDVAGRYVFANSYYYRITNNRPEQLLGKLPDEALRAGATVADHSSEHHALIIETGKPIEMDEVRQGADGKTRHIHVVKSPVFDSEGKITGSQGILFDVTESRLADEALRESKERYRTLVSASPDAVTVTDVEGRIEFVSSRTLELFGQAAEDEMVGCQIWDWFAPEEREKARNNLAQIVAKTPLRNHELTLLNKQGDRFNGEISAALFYSANSLPKGIIFITRDITERKRAAEAHMRLATAVEQTTESIVITDNGGAILYVNPAFEKTTGYSLQESVGKNPRMLKSDRQGAAFFQKMWQTLATGESWSGNMVNRKKDGTLFEEECTISPIRNTSGQIVNYVAVKRDVTREVEMEGQLRQSQKMDAVGQLAGGIAHDFNNLLTAIRGNASLLLMGAQTMSPDMMDCAQQIVEASERAANLTRQLLTFSRKQVVQPTRLDLNGVVVQMTKLLQRILGEDISLVSANAASLPPIQADAGMIEQILLNLAVNSRDAMPNGGQLIITTGKEIVNHPPRSNSKARSGPYVRLTVADTGCGIPPENLPRIFEPFYTTKEVGKGTGLGLATVHGIVEQHHGWITVSSEVGKGTAFHIYFPVVTEPQAEKSARPMASTHRGGTETILVVEDERIVRLSLTNILQRFGYTVLQAENGLSALKVWEQSKSRIQLVLTDVVMPDGMSGFELARRLQADKPQLKVIYTSGYTANLADKRLVLKDGVNFLQKPYTTQKLSEALRANLDPD